MLVGHPRLGGTRILGSRGALFLRHSTPCALVRAHCRARPVCGPTPCGGQGKTRLAKIHQSKYLYILVNWDRGAGTPGPKISVTRGVVMMLHFRLCSRRCKVRVYKWWATTRCFPRCPEPGWDSARLVRRWKLSRTSTQTTTRRLALHSSWRPPSTSQSLAGRGDRFP